MPKIREAISLRINELNAMILEQEHGIAVAENNLNLARANLSAMHGGLQELTRLSEIKEDVENAG